MKRISFAVSVVVLVFGGVIIAQTQTASVEQALIKLEKEWDNAEVKKDATFFDRIMADDFIGTGASSSTSVVTSISDQPNGGQRTACPR